MRSVLAAFSRASARIQVVLIVLSTVLRVNVDVSMTKLPSTILPSECRPERKIDRFIGERDSPQLPCGFGVARSD